MRNTLAQIVTKQESTVSVTLKIIKSELFSTNYIFLYPFLIYRTLTVFFIFSLDLYTIGRTPWTSDRPVARPLPKYRTTQTLNKRTNTHTPNIHTLNGIRTHDDSVRASEDSSWLRPLGYRDRPQPIIKRLKFCTSFSLHDLSFSNGAFLRV
jgi:hypothetical protein